jgi:hypothetical protein
VSGFKGKIKATMSSLPSAPDKTTGTRPFSEMEQSCDDADYDGRPRSLTTMLDISTLSALRSSRSKELDDWVRSNSLLATSSDRGQSVFLENEEELTPRTETVSVSTAIDRSQGDRGQPVLPRGRRRSRARPSSPAGDIRLPLFTICEANELCNRSPTADTNEESDPVSHSDGAHVFIPIPQHFPSDRGPDEEPYDSQRRTQLILEEALRQSVSNSSSAGDPETPSDRLLDSTLRAETRTQSLMFSPSRPVRHRSPPPG